MTEGRHAEAHRGHPFPGRKALGFLSLLEEQRWGRITSNSYAVRVTGDCLAPVFQDGDRAVICPTTTPEPGDYVLLAVTHKSEPEEVVIKRLAFALPPDIRGPELMGAVIVEQTNPPKRYILPQDRVRVVHKVIGIYREE